MGTANQTGMTSKAEQVLELALQLSESERADVAAQLIRSLDPDIDPDADEAWEKEIARRLAEVESGLAEYATWEEVQKSMDAILES